jgi:cytoskeletal protein RodZ
MKQIMMIIILLLSYPNLAAIYQWTDEQGVTHFSDDKSKPASAQKIEVKLTPPAIESLTQSRTPEASSANSTLSEMPSQPIGIRINSPVDQQTLRSNSGNITVSATLSSSLQYGSNIRLLIDGMIHSKQINSQFNVTNIPLGTHKLQLQIVNNLGKVIASSELITVYLHRFKAN